MPDSSGETNVPVGDWTTGTLKVYHDEKIAFLKEHLEQRFTDSDKAVQAALLAAKEAVLKAEVATEKRFESVNEFRKTLSDQTAGFLPRPEYDANHKALEDKIDNKYETLTEKLTSLTTMVSAIENRSNGMKDGWKILTGVIATGATIVFLILAFNN